MSAYHVSLLVTVFMYVALAGSWNLFSGMTGYVSLGHGLFFGIGAYSFAIATAVFQLPPVVGLALGVVVPGLLGVADRPRAANDAHPDRLFRGRHAGLERDHQDHRGERQIDRLVVRTDAAVVCRTVTSATTFCSVIAVAVTSFAYAVQRSRWGYGLRAILADEVAAETTGIGTVAHKLAMFVASAVFIGMTGAMVCWNWSYIDPYMAFDLTVSFDMLVMAMFGGFGTVAGPVLGAVAMSLVKEVLSTAMPHFQPIVFGVLVIALILWCPGGMVQAFEAARSKLRGWLPQRAAAS